MRAINLLVYNHSGRHDSYQFGTTPEISASITQLLDAFQALPPSNAPIATQATEPDEEEEEMDDDDDLIQSDLTTPAVVENPTLYCSKIQPSLRALLFLLYTQRHTPNTPQGDFSVY